MTTTSEKILQQIAKELHDMNKKLDRLGQASIFNKDSKVYADPEPETFYYNLKFEEDDSQNNHIL
jgi:hypothetical protein